MKNDYAIIVKSTTRLTRLIERFNTRSQARFYIERLGGNFEDYILEDEIFNRSLHEAQTKLSKIIKNKIVDRDFLPNYIFSENNLIIVIGQDGLVANTAKYSNNLPIIGVNPDKGRYDGVLLPFDSSDFMNAVTRVLDNDFNSRTMNMAEARTTDGQKLLAFNDLFIGVRSHTSAKYRITFADRSEEQSSSGVIVSTEAGATGWLSSIFNMAHGITAMSYEGLRPKRPSLRSNELLFVVREPFKSIRTDIDIAGGIIRGENELTVESYMPDHGVIFSDGIERDFLQFNSGQKVTVSLAKEQAKLVIKT